MATFADRLALIITADPRAAVAGLEKVGTTANRELSKAQTALDKTGRNLTKLGVGAVATGAVMLYALNKAAHAYEVSEQASLKLSNTIRNQPALAGASQKSLEKLADSLQHVTAFSNQEIVAGMARLGMYGLTQAQLQKTIPLVLDLAQKTGKDVVTASAAFGKALNGNLKGLKAMGVQVDATTYAQDRLKAVAEAVTIAAGGAAKEFGDTFAGKLARTKNELQDVEEHLGKGVVSALGDLLSVTQKGTQSFGALGDKTQEGVGRFATYTAATLVASGVLSVAAGQAIKFWGQISAMGDAITTMRLKTMYAQDAVAGLGLSAGETVAAGLLPLTAVAATVGAFMVADRQKAHDLAKGVQELGDEAQRTGHSLQYEFLQALRDLRDEQAGPLDDVLGHTSNGFKQMADELGLSAEQLNSHLSDNKDAFEKWRDAQVRAIIQQTASSTSGVILERGLNKLRSAYEQTGGSTEKAAKAAEEHKAALEENAKAVQDAMGVQWAYGQSLTDTKKAQEDAAQAQVDAARKIEDADRNVSDAEKDLRDAHQDVADAVADVAKAYDDARQQLADYQDQVTEGGFSVRDAQFGVADAQKALTEAQAKGDPDEIARAQLRLEEAQYRLQQAEERLTDAKKDLNTATQKGLDQSPQVLDAQKRVKDAKDRERDATEKLTKAEQDRKDAVADGAKAVEEANGKVLDALRKQNEALWIAIANWDALAKAQRLTGGEGYIAGGAGNRGGKPDDPGGANGGRAPTGGRSLTGRKGGDTYISVTIDGETQTTRSAIHKGIEKANKQAALTYGRRFAA